MANYTFHSLSDGDFEDLARDLLGASLKIPFQSFAKGRDSGIDLLHGLRLRGSTVVQCKHYCRSKFANLKSKIIVEEVPKLAQIKPSRFILATSLGLTPQNKEELLGILAPFCKGVNDIYGQDDINALLNQYPAVETSHYKLWLTSVPVLQRVLRHGAAVWNAMTREDIERKMSLYVQTAAYEAARAILLKNNYCILSGIPGIGKTTLAQVVVTRLMDEGYELIAVRDDVQEAFEALEVAKNQVVYYDDFLGQSSINEKLGKNEDKGIVRLLKESHRSKHLKVIFTTREYILEDAKRVYEPLNSGELDVARCVVKVEDYTRGHRARILYNHVYFSDLPQSFTAALLKDRGYRRIVDHKGYSPRIVEWMTLGAGSAGVQPDDYLTKFVQALDDPAELWQHAFENQISEDARAVLYCLGTIEGWLGLDELSTVWANVRGLVSTDGLSIENKRAFRAAMKQLDGSFVRTNRMGSETAVEFHNPSIKDYMRRRIVSDPDVRMELLRRSLFFEQVSCLVRLSKTGHIGHSPNLLIPDDSTLHESIERTINVKPATYRFININGGMRLLARMTPDFGERLTTVANWAKSYSSKALLSLSCRIAANIVASGDAEKAATVESCGFLAALVAAYPDDEGTTSIVISFIVYIKDYMVEIPTADDWIKWSNFLQTTNGLFDKREIGEWAQQAESFCKSEIDLIIRETKSSSQAQSWYDDVASVAERWALSLESNLPTFNKWLDELRCREEEPNDEDVQRESPPSAPMADDNAVIDRLFDSLNDRASEAD